MLTINPNYNPNDYKSNRWISSASTPTPSISSIFSPIVKPFTDYLSNTKTSSNNNTPTYLQSLLQKNKTTTPANMSIYKPNMSIVPTGQTTTQTPAVQVTKNIPDTTLPNKTAGTVSVNVPTSTAQTPKVPLTNTGAIDYNALAQQAGQAGLSVQDYLGLVAGQATPGTKEMDDLYTKLGIPDLVTQVYSKPAKTTQSIYEDYYNKSGLGDIKSKIASLDTELKTIRDGYTSAVKEHQDNPWLSAATRSAKIAREKDLYGKREANAIALRSSYLEQYNLGVDEIEKTVGRISGDLEYDRTLNADKLNYLLNEAERKAGLATTDATKEGLRYAGSFLTSRYKEKLGEENRAQARAIQLKKLESGSDIANAIAGLSKTNPNAGGYFGALNNILALKDSTAEKSKLATSTLTSYLKDGNEAQAREYLQQLALGSLSGTDKSDALKRTQSINAINSIKEKLNSYVKKYGDTNLLNGSFQDIQQSLGLAGNTDAANLNAELTKLLQEARVQTTGAAWGKQEDKEYEKVNASLKNKNKLNLSILDANLDILNRNNASAIAFAIGPTTYDQLYKPGTMTGNTSTASTSWVPDFITQARASGKTDAEIAAYLASKGIN